MISYSSNTMVRVGTISALLTLTAAFAAASEVDGDTPPRSTCDQSLANGTLFDFSIKNVYENASIDLNAFRGKLTLVVNVATY